MKVIVLTLQEIWQETKTKVFKNKKKYTRKDKRKSKYERKIID
jgi:hypothetical protein